MVNLNLLFTYLRSESPLPKEMQQILRDELKLDRQWKNILFVDNIPL